MIAKILVGVFTGYLFNRHICRERIRRNVYKQDKRHNVCCNGRVPLNVAGEEYPANGTVTVTNTYNGGTPWHDCRYYFLTPTRVKDDG